jgi:hypothetical protein
MRTAFAILCWCVLLALGGFVGPASAGGGFDGYYERYRDYPRYRDGYHPRRHHGRVWYSSDCCYKKIVRHERTSRYVRIHRQHRYGYYEPPYRPYRPYRPYGEGYYSRPPMQYGEYYVVPPQPPLPPPRYQGGYSAYDAYNAYNYVPDCTQRRVRVLDGRGGWVWGSRQVCN